MKKVIVFLITVVFCLSFPPKAVAASPTVTLTVTPSINLTDLEEVIEATEAAEEATPAGIIEKVVEKKPDITKPEETKGKLEAYLDGQKLGPLSVSNFLKYAIRSAIDRGVPANTIVLLLLLPMVAALIAGFRHLVGLEGFGIFTPAVISAAFIATGITTGMLIFVVILLTATFGRRVIRKLKMQYLPRMAFLLWFVCLGVFGAILIAPQFQYVSLATVSIFPILIMVLLAEDFMSVQISKNFRTAARLTLETFAIALVSYWIMTAEAIQKNVLLNPETVVLAVAVFDIFVGKYVGLRLLEYWKFRKLIKK